MESLDQYLKYRKKKALGLCAVLLFALGGFQGFFFNPLVLFVSSDALLANEVVLMLLDVIYSFLNLLFYWIGLTFLLFFCVRFSSVSLLPLFAIYTSAAILRYASALLSGYLLMGFPLIDDFLTDALYLGIDVLLDLVIWGIALLVASLSLRDCFVNKNGAGETALTKHVPFSKLLDFKNPISKAMAFIACVPSVFQILYRIRYDLYIGVPSDVIDLLWMILYYVTDLITILIAYFVMLSILNCVHLREMRSKALYDEDLSDKASKEGT